MYFLNINKPKGISSFDAIRRLRKKLNLRQIGHSGTLDPLASGVLQIGVGLATRLLDYLPSDKTYIAEITFGYTTDTFDSEGTKNFISKPDFTKAVLLETLEKFIGKIRQIPPKYSAIKVNGKKLCDLARKNNIQDIRIQERDIEIYSIVLLNFENYTAKIKVHCSKGTYIRSLANDIGSMLGCGAYLSGLERILAGNFSINNSDELDCDNFNQINPLDAIELPKIEINDFEFERVKNGNPIKNTSEYNCGTVLLKKDNILVSVANLSDNLIKPKKIFYRG